MSFGTASVKQGFSFVGRNVLALGIAWLTGLALVQLGIRLGDGWVGSWTGVVFGCAAGVGIAYVLKAWPSAVFWFALTVWSASRFVIQPLLGENAVRGAETHLLGMGVSVAVSAAIVLFAYSRRTGNTSAHV